MSHSGDEVDFAVKEQDRSLPVANIARIMKKALPDNAKIAKEAKECIQECVSEFISFITSEASDRCQQEKRKTINGEDVLWAMQSLGFENYTETLRLYLLKHRMVTKVERQAGVSDTLIKEEEDKSKEHIQGAIYLEQQQTPTLYNNGNMQ